MYYKKILTLRSEKGIERIHDEFAVQGYQVMGKNNNASVYIYPENEEELLRVIYNPMNILSGFYIKMKKMHKVENHSIKIVVVPKFLSIQVFLFVTNLLLSTAIIIITTALMLPLKETVLSLMMLLYITANFFVIYLSIMF